MNIENIEAFVYVQHYGSFMRAAEQLFLSQPSVTARIQSLERELGCKLFNRDSKKIKLTEEGVRFLPFAQQIIQTLQIGKKQIHIDEGKQQTVRIGGTYHAAHYVIPHVLRCFKEEENVERFSITAGSSSEILQKVLNKEIDIGFVQDINHPHIHLVKVLEDPIQLFVYKDHPLLAQEKIQLQHLENESIVFFECKGIDWSKIRMLMEEMKSKQSIPFHTDNMETAKRLIMQKLGIGFLPSLSVYEEVLSEKLFPIKMENIGQTFLQMNVASLNDGNNNLSYKIQRLLKKFHFPF